MAILTTNITYGGKTPTEAPDGGNLKAALIFQAILAMASFQSLGYDLREDIQTSEDMYSIIPSDKVTRKKTTCGWNPYGSLGELRDKKITVTELAIEMEQCAKDFDGKILQLVKKKGFDRYDLTGTQFEEILRELAQPIISRDMNRIISLADTASANADYNQIDGKWKKIYTGVAGGTIKKAADLPATGPLADGAARTALDAVHFDAPIELQTMAEADKVKVVTRSVYNNYLKSFASNADLESAMTVLQTGLKTVTHWGVPVVVEDLVDAYVAADFAGADPHRIYYTALNNITVGTDMESDFTEVDFWYEKKEQMNLMRVNYKLGVAFGWDKLFSVAY
ncbi:hypothetical protein [Rufibacter latericius]|uniref:Phage major capsid protein n=1 Tax=Rufibacter latericius TaxID=2487040 RepID=A0A3M9MP60_9BACT|nr:hypothetical protein [Rufibacter latericius]RNI26633.1 hypothetical protein EFB08_11485 [Rufibacter latericius]